jgi:undecaprenyl phosphate N,N'-diacetylbacillosamine 1-phosphate transferase
LTSKQNTERSFELAIKRVVDLLVATVSLLILAPFLAGIALAIRLTSPGPALFRQQRLGKGQVPFACYKFRTMYVDSPDLRNPDGSTFNAEDDPRVTRVGRFLRKTSLDELPQLLNVFKGDMSLVGPRPDIVEAISLYKPGDEKRLAVKPGMTGWAVIHGRNAVPLDQRRAFDLEYVDKFSLALDFRILLRTVPFVLLGKGLYAPQPSEERNVDVQD